MNRNEWFNASTGMNDSLNEDEWMIHWINMNEWCD